MLNIDNININIIIRSIRIFNFQKILYDNSNRIQTLM